jgi:hypothetical protein
VSSNIERSIEQIERWIEAIQQEKDYHGTLLSNPELSAVSRQFACARLSCLDVELNNARELLTDLQAKRHRPELLFEERPRHHRLLRVPLRRKARKTA